MKKHDSWNYLSLRLEQTQKELLQDLVYFAVQPAGKRGGIARFSSILRGFFADKLRGQLGGEVPEDHLGRHHDGRCAQDWPQHAEAGQDSAAHTVRLDQPHRSNQLAGLLAFRS